MSPDERERRVEEAVARLARLAENCPKRYASLDEAHSALIQMNGGQQPTLSLEEAFALLADMA
ncbi:MAG TPA: hypothetical protein VE360_15225, partial [Pyrinomonadaceae bacterium]|nr:hypothetical protein [Pyrinomonadaceae bacterium]